MLKPTLKQRKDRIAKVAAKVFLQKGYKTASLQDIAQKARMSKAGLFHYFKTKEEILDYLIKGMTYNFIQMLENCIKRSEKEDLNAEEALKRYIATYAYFLNKSREIPLLILRERHQLTGKYKKGIYKIEHEIFNRMKNELKKVPSIDKKYDLNVISFLIISMSHWIGYWLKQKESLNLDSVIQQNIDIIFHGILKNRVFNSC